MPVPTHKLKSGRTVKLGRRVPANPPRVVKLANFLHRPAGLMGVPESVNYWDKASRSLMEVLGNDQQGDCVIASSIHSVGVHTANNPGAGGEVVGNTREALATYHQWCGPGDNGCYILDVLNREQSEGIPIAGKRHKIDGYVGVDAKNFVELKVAFHLFGRIRFGIDLPADWLNTDDGDKWDVTSSRSVGGHDVPMVGYDAEGVVISTWGGKRTITWAALQSGRYVDECYAVLAPDWYINSDLAPSGVNVDALRKALQDFQNGIVPPDEPPGPGPGPTPPGPTPPGPAHAPIIVTLPGAALEWSTTGGAIDEAGYVPSGASLTWAGPITIGWQTGHAMAASIPWALIFALLAKYGPIILADLAAGKTWAEILADLLAGGKKAAAIESGKKA